MKIEHYTVDSNEPYRFNAPVRLFVWSRAEYQQAQFEVIKLAKPKVLFWVSDYGRNQQEIDSILLNREIINQVNWKCEIHKIYFEKNQGPYSTWIQSSKYIWSITDRCILLEDDDIPSISFFDYCDELLEKYKNDLRIQCICGMNSVGVYEECPDDYFFSKAGSIWGVAYWRRTFDQFFDSKYGNNQYVFRLLKRNLLKSDRDFDKQIDQYISSQLIKGRPAGDEYYLRVGTYLFNQLKIVPKKNLITNIGCDSKATHSSPKKLLPYRIQKLYDIKAYELNFPLKHPQYVISDTAYEKLIDDIHARGKTVVPIIRHFEVALRKIFYGEFASLSDSIKRRLSSDKRPET